MVVRNNGIILYIIGPDKLELLPKILEVEIQIGTLVGE